MKVKDLEKTVNLAWSPRSQYPILLAAGTTAQQLDASFSTTAALDIYSVNLGDPSLDLELRHSVSSELRFHKLAWGGYGYGEDAHSGLIVGGCDAGHILVYNPTKLLNKENGVIANLTAHSGAVRALDFNSFQKNLLASGATESEIYIWDLNNLSTPMTPGTASQPPDDVVSLSWNKQVQHILTTTFATRCMVWDLRKNEPIIKLTDTAAKSRWRVVTWNPQVATQLCLASEEDQYPVIQLWDLRFATSPVKTFEGHQKGVLSVSWSNDDPDLLISCGKDNKLLVWNPNTEAQHGEIVCDMTINTNWNFEVSWCPRNPFLVSTSSFDGRASVYSLSGGKPAAPTSNKIADSFPGMNQYPQSLPPQQLLNHQLPVIELLKPPKWMKKPVGVSFGFGGKLVSFASDQKTVYVSQVVTETDLMMKYQELENILQNSNAFTHCYNKAEQAVDPLVKDVWQFIACQVNGEQSFRSQAIMFLGTSPPTLNEKLRTLNISLEDSNSKAESPSVSDSFSHVSRIGPADSNDIFDNLATQQQNSSSSSVIDGAGDFEILKKPLKFPAQSNDVESALCDALLLGDIELAVKLCVHKNRWSDAIILSVHGGHELAAKTREQYFKKSDNYLTALISAIVNEDWSTMVETCELTNWKQILVTMLTYIREDEFRAMCELLGQRLLIEGDDSMKRNALICFVFAGDVNQLIKHWNSNIKSPGDIQELVELGLIMRVAAKYRGIDIPISGSLASVLVQYAELLASQGYLEAAETYLGDSQDDNIQELKERLMYAVGKKIAYANNPTMSTGRTNAYYQPQQRRPSQPNPYNSPFQASPYSASTKNLSKPPLMNEVQPLSSQPVATLPPIQPAKHALPPNVAPLQPSTFSAKPPSFPPKVSNSTASVATPFMSNGYATSTTPANPTTQPLPPMSTTGLFPPATPTSTTVGPTSTMFPFSSQTQPPTFNQIPTAAPFGASAAKPPTIPAPPPNVAPMSRSTPTPPAPPLSSQVPYNNARQTPDHVSSQGRNKYVLDPSVQGAGGFRNNFSSSGFLNMQPIMNQPQSINPTAPFMSHNDSTAYSMSNQNIAFPPSQADVTSYIPNSTVPTMPTSMFQPTIAPAHDIPKVAPMMPPSSAPPGWNDPPSVSLDKTPKVLTNMVSPVSPITHPLYGSVPENSAMSAMNNSYPHGGAPPQQMGMYPGVPSSFQQNNVHQMRPPRAPVAEEVRPKPALPEEHVHLQTVLDTLRQQCYNKTMNSQMKRKLDDVARKLEMLYDAIRDNKLSKHTLAGLHEIVNAIQQQNYQNCLSLHTQLVSGPDFATIASFMPGIKVLVQSALQLEVYL